MRGRADSELVLEYLRGHPVLANLGWVVYEASVERKKPDLDREAAYMDRTWEQTKERLLLAQKNFVETADKAILKELLVRALALKAPNRIAGLDALFKGGTTEADVDAFIARAYQTTRLADPKALTGLLGKSTAELKAVNDPFIALAEALAPATLEVRERQKTRKGALDTYFARLSDVREAFLGKNFIPDANNTLRLTYGRIKGYNPVDGVRFEPFTTLGGVLDKTTGTEPFITPAKLFDLHKAKRLRPLRPPRAQGHPGLHALRRRHHGRQQRQPRPQRPRRARRGQLRPDLRRHDQ